LQAFIFSSNIIIINSFIPWIFNIKSINTRT
jgi:hypothetical protein